MPHEQVMMPLAFIPLAHENYHYAARIHYLQVSLLNMLGMERPMLNWKLNCFVRYCGDCGYGRMSSFV